MNRRTSIIILTYNQIEYTKKCIESIRQYTKEGTYEIIIVDNCSTDGTKEWLKEQPDLKIIYNDQNMGFPKGCNQGIQASDVENDILLLNNDTIVTENWLTNLKICLESEDAIGAVGSVCNQQENRQGVSFTYENFQEMQVLAKQNNKSDRNRWEEKIFLIGFCLLIKREVMDQIINLDEEYYPGYIEDNDLALRINQLGYKLMLCHDSFIHHYLGTSFRKDLNKFYPILFKNRAYFYKKWNFETIAFDEVKSASYPLIQNPHKILELDCGIGATILELRYKYNLERIEGIEENSYKRKISSKIAKVYEHLNSISNRDYDYILIGTLLEKVNNPKYFIEKIKKYGAKDCYLVGEIHNAISIQKINVLLNGNFKTTFEKQKTWYTIKELKQLFEESGYTEFEYYSWYENYTEEENRLLKNISTEYPDASFTYYTFRAKIPSVK